MLKLLELVFVFFSKIYVFFYKDKGGYWKFFPVIIMSTIIMINIEVVLLQFFSVRHFFLFVILFVVPLLSINFLIKKRNYSWVVQYSISKKQRIIISVILLIDFILVGILFNVARNNNLGIH